MSSIPSRLIYIYYSVKLKPKQTTTHILAGQKLSLRPQINQTKMFFGEPFDMLLLYA